MSESNEKGNIGEAAFASALQLLGFVTRDELREMTNAADRARIAGIFTPASKIAYRDSNSRAIADFEIFHTADTRDSHIDVKCHDTWHWYAPLQTWQAGVGIELLRDYQSRAAAASETTGRAPASAHVVVIKRGLMAFGKRDNLPLPNHPSPAGVWIASVDDLIDQGFEHYIPGEKGIGMCSTRAIDGGVWHPFAPWCETTHSIIVRRSEDPAAWDAFFAREMQQIVLP